MFQVEKEFTRGQKNNLQLWLSEKHTCENCGKIMTEKYGSGRFCCSFCAHVRQQSEETKEKISSTLAKINNPDQFDNISDDAFIEAFNKATSVDGLIQTISAINEKHITRNGIQRQCKRLGLNLDDIKPQAKSLDDILSNKVPFTHTSRLKQKLLDAGYKEDKCECCGQGPEWLGKRLPLELHHVDGNRENNSLENLKILCPNCHSQTDTFRSKNRKKK